MLVPEMLVLVNRDDREIGIETKFMYIKQVTYIERFLFLFFEQDQVKKKFYYSKGI